MTAPDSKQPARRTYASLEACRGFRAAYYKEPHYVSICPMAGRTRWRFVGTGNPTAKDALYEEVGQ